MSNQYLKTFKAAQESEKLFGGTPKQEHKINELEKVENKPGPAAASSSQEKAPSSSIEGATIYNPQLEAQTHDSDGGKTSTPIPNAQVHGFALEARDSGLQNSGLSSPLNHYAKITSILNDPQTYDNGDGHQTHDGRTSAIILNPQTHDGMSSSSSPSSNHYARITSILNDSQADNGNGHQTHYERASSTISTHDGRTQTYGGRVSSSPTLLRYSTNYYARIPSILDNPQIFTLPSFPWFLNNLNESNDVILPPIYNNSTPQQVHLRTLEPDHEPDVPKLPFQL